MKQLIKQLLLVFFISSIAIFGQPVISQQPQNQSVSVGESATFSLTATGVEPLIYQWYKNGVSIAGASLNSYTTPSTIIQDDGSTFYCIVADSNGFVESDIVLLSVSYPNIRVTDGLQVLYDFNEGSGTTINDNSGVGTPLNLSIDNSNNVNWTDNGLNINSRVQIKSDNLATKIFNSCTGSNEITIEAWLMPSTISQTTYYKRILTMGNDNFQERNFGLIQNNGNFYSYIRTTSTGQNGGETVDATFAKPIHFVFTRNNAGQIITYIDGVKSSENTVGGNFSNWDNNYYLFVGNEVANQSVLYWQGTYYQLAIYSKALSANEVEQNYNFGTTLDSFPVILDQPQDVTASVGQTATFTVTAIGENLSYQWKRNGSNISGANSDSFTTPALLAGNNGDTYSCEITSGGNTLTSSGANLIVLIPGNRITDGAIAIYNFSEGSGTVVNDVSGFRTALNLNISDENDVNWSQNGLEITSEASIISNTPATKIYDECTTNNEFSIEAWIKPANITQSGTARIVTFSQDANFRNFTLAQDSNRYEFRVRTDQSDNNGKVVTTPDGTAETALQHIVVVVSVNNVARVYVNGVEQLNKDLGNNISTWDNSYRLAIANELLDSRPWLGTFNYVAIFNRVLFAEEVQHNYEVGPFGVGNVLAPSNLVASETTVGQVNLNWVDNSNNEDIFLIERSIIDTLHFIQIGEVSTNATSYTDTTVSEGTVYYYRVKAFNNFTNNGSDFSNNYLLISNLFTPSELNSDASMLGEVSLTWTDNSESEIGYILERATGDPAVYSVIDSVSQNSYTDMSVDEGVLYSYRVKAYSDVIESSYSNVNTVRSKASFVNKPTDLTVELHAIFGIPVLTWVDNAFNENGFVIERRLIKIGTTFNVIDTVGEDEVTYMDETVQDSSSYIYRIYAFNDEYVSDTSAAIFIDVLTGVEDEAVPTEFSLSQNYPNPFNPSTIIKFGLPSNSDVVIKVYNLLGQELITLIDNRFSAGNYLLNFDASKLSSGIYIYTIIANSNDDNNFVQSKKMILIK